MKPLALIAFLAASSALAFEGETEATVSVSGTNARTSADLSTGIKEVDCDVAVYYRMGTSSAVATTSDAPRGANTRWYVNITNDGRRLAFITGGGTGTCRIYPVNVLASSRAAGALIFSPVVAHPITDIGSVATFGANASVTVTAGTTCFCSPSGDAVTVCSLIGTTLFITLAASDGMVNYVCYA